MDSNLLKKISKLLIKHPEIYITSPKSLFDKEISKRYQSLLVKKNAFIKFHEYMFSQSNEALALISAGHKKHNNDMTKKESSVNYLDVFLLKDAIQYHLTLRLDKTLDIACLTDIAKSWRDNVKESNKYESVDSEHLIRLAESFKQHADE